MINYEIERHVKQVMPLSDDWTFNYLYFDEGGIEVVSLPVVGLAVVEWIYPADPRYRDEVETESHIEAVCLEDGGFKPDSLLEARDCDNVYVLGIKKRGETITAERIKRATESYKNIQEWRQKEAAKQEAS